MAHFSIALLSWSSLVGGFFSRMGCLCNELAGMDGKKLGTKKQRVSRLPLPVLLRPIFDTGNPSKVLVQQSYFHEEL